MMVEKRDWNEYNTKLVNRGRPSTYLSEALKRQNKDLIDMNKGKVGSPYQYSFMLILGAFAIKCVDRKVIERLQERYQITFCFVE